MFDCAAVKHRWIDEVECSVEWKDGAAANETSGCGDSFGSLQVEQADGVLWAEQVPPQPPARTCGQVIIVRKCHCALFSQWTVAGVSRRSFAHSLSECPRRIDSVVVHRDALLL